MAIVDNAGDFAMIEFIKLKNNDKEGKIVIHHNHDSVDHSRVMTNEPNYDT